MELQQTNQILSMVKANLGISTTVRDEYLKAIIGGVMNELNDKGVVAIGNSDSDFLMLAVDYASWQYRSRGEGTMPRNIRYRLNNRIVKGAVNDE